MGNFTLQSQKQVISVPFSLVGIKKAGNHFDFLLGGMFVIEIIDSEFLLLLFSFDSMLWKLTY